MDVKGWLRDLGLGQYEQAFRDNDIDAGLLPTLTADDLRELGVVSLGHRKRLLAAIATLERLAEAELVFGRGTLPEASYTFKHALVRDAAHEGLLKAERQRAARAHRPGAGGALP
jgi:hypothetical protein